MKALHRALDAALMLGGIVCMVYGMVRLIYVDGPLGLAFWGFCATVVSRHLLSTISIGRD